MLIDDGSEELQEQNLHLCEIGATETEPLWKGKNKQTAKVKEE